MFSQVVFGLHPSPPVKCNPLAARNSVGSAVQATRVASPGFSSQVQVACRVPLLAHIPPQITKNPLASRLSL